MQTKDGSLEMVLNFDPNDDRDEADETAASDEDYFEACLARSDLQELGLRDISAWASWRVHRAAPQLLEEYRAARSAADLDRPQAGERLKAAAFRLYETALATLEDFPGWTAPKEKSGP